MLLILRLAVVAAALAAALAPIPPSLVERLYSGALYPAWQRAATALSNRVPFSLLDVLLVLVALRVVFILARVAVPGKRTFAGSALGALVRLAALVAVVYLAFLASWGLNYRRPALASRLDYASGRATPDAAAALARRLASGANGLHAAAHAGAAQGWYEVASGLRKPFAQVQGQVGAPGGAVPGRAKWSVLTYYFEPSGVSGMTDPFFLEVLVNQGLLPFERPAVLAHEWAHLAGFADESEANFLGWLVCLQGPPTAQYSAHLAILWDLMPSLPRAERDRVARELAAGPRADLRAIAERVAKTTPALRDASWKVYDRYLRANRVGAGVQSYEAALGLLLGTKMAPGWKPVRRQGSGGAGDGA